MPRCKSRWCYPNPCDAPVVPGTDYCKRHSPDYKSARQHPRVKCNVCGEPVGYQIGMKWERGQRAYMMKLSGQLPDYKKLEKLPDPKDPVARRKAYREYRNAISLACDAEWFKRRKVPPTCCLVCQREARKKLNVPNGIRPRAGCLMCREGSARIAGLVCSNECGIKLAKKAIANGLSFEVKSLESEKSDGGSV